MQYAVKHKYSRCVCVCVCVCVCDVDSSIGSKKKWSSFESIMPSCFCTKQLRLSSKKVGTNVNLFLTYTQLKTKTTYWMFYFINFIFVSTCFFWIVFLIYALHSFPSFWEVGLHMWNNAHVFKDIVLEEPGIDHWWTWTLGRSTENHPGVCLERKTHSINHGEKLTFCSIWNFWNSSTSLNSMDW